MGCGHDPDTGRRARALIVAVLVIAPLAWSERALAAPSVTITSPGSAVVVTSDVLTVRAEVMSFYGLRSVRATVETVGVDLVLSQPAAWAGTMNLSTVADGMRTLTVTATDVYGAVGMASTSIMLDRRPPADRPPTLTVRAPVDGRVAHRTIPVDFSCADDGPGGCASVQVIIGATVVATGKDGLMTNVPAPSASDGQSIVVDLVGTDSAGQRTVLRRMVYVEIGPGLTEILHVPGTLLDFDASHLLYLNPAGTALIRRDRSSLTDVTIVEGLKNQPKTAAPYPVSQALYKGTVLHAIDGPLVHWKGPGDVVTYPGGSFKLAGPYLVTLVIVRDLMGADNARPNRRHLDTGASSVAMGDPLFPHRTDGIIPFFDVAPNGDIMYTVLNPSGGTYLNRGATGETIIVSPDIRYEYALTNGEGVLFPTQAAGGVGISLFTVPSGAVLEVARPSARPAWPLPLKDYVFAGKWIGFTRPSVDGGPLQAWTRSPAGVDTDCSTLNQPVTIAGLSPTGEIVFEASGRRYLSSATSLPPRWVASTQGRVVRKESDDVFHLIIAGTLFRIGPPGPEVDAGAPRDVAPPADSAGPPDAGAVDAPIAPDAANDAARADAAAMPDGASPDRGANDAGSTDPPRDPGCQCTQGGGRGGTLLVWLVMAIAVARAARRRSDP